MMNKRAYRFLCSSGDTISKKANFDEEELFHKIRDFVFDNEEKIWELAVANTTPISDAVVYLDNIFGDMSLSAGTYTTGSWSKVPDDSIVLYTLSRDWRDELTDVMNWEWDDELETYRRTPEHVDYDEDNPDSNVLGKYEMLREYYEVGFENFYSEIRSKDFWRKIEQEIEGKLR